MKVEADNKIEGVSVFHDIPYIPGSTHEKHYLDVYVPSHINDTEKTAPVVFFVHGGGWKRGDRKWNNWPTRGRLYKNVGYACAKQGFVCVVISYRLSSFGRKKNTFEGEDIIKHPDHIKDVAQAYKWTSDNVETYHGDKSEIFLMGHSAGAHLVTLLSLDTSYLIEAKAPVQNIKGVIGISGVYNFDRLQKTSFGIANYFYIQPMTNSNDISILPKISPLTHARITPFPFLFLNAKYDFHLQLDAAEMTEALQLLGVDVVHLTNIHTHHGSIIQCVGSKKDTVTPLIFAWIQKKIESVNHKRKDMEKLENEIEDITHLKLEENIENFSNKNSIMAISNLVEPI